MPGGALPGPLSTRAVPAPIKFRMGTHLKHAAPPRVHDIRAGRGQGLPRLGQGPADGTV